MQKTVSVVITTHNRPDYLKESLAAVSSMWREFKLKERVLETRFKDLEDRLQTETTYPFKNPICRGTF